MNKRSALNKLADFYETIAQSPIAQNTYTTQAVYPSPLNSGLSTQPADKAPAAQNSNMAAASGTQQALTAYQTAGTAAPGTYSTVNHVSGKGRKLNTEPKPNPPTTFTGSSNTYAGSDKWARDMWDTQNRTLSKQLSMNWNKDLPGPAKGTKA